MLFRITVVFLLAQILAHGQDAWKVLFPSDGQADVSPSAVITVRCPYPIDTSQWRAQDYPFVVLRDSIAQITPRETWTRHRVVGRYQVNDEYTFSWIPRRLLPSTRYRCLSGAGEFTFVTAPDVPSVLRCNIPNEAINCGQQLEVELTSPLPEGCLADSVFVVEQLASAGLWRPAPHNILRTGTGVRITPVGRWQQNAQLRLRVRCSWYAGDKQLDRTYEAMVRGAAKVVCTVRERHGRVIDKQHITGLETNNRVVVSGDTLRIRAPRILKPDLVFSHWDCPQLPELHADTTLQSECEVSCENMYGEIRIEAVYERRDSIRVRVEVDSGGSVDVYTTLGEYLGHVTDTTTISSHVAHGNLVCIAKPGKEALFSMWLYQGSIVGSSAIVIPGRQAISVYNLSLNPRFQVLRPTLQDRYRLRGSITDVDADPLYSAADAVRFTTPYEYESTAPGTRPLCVAADRCWEIIGYCDQSSGTPVWFDRGLREYCITAEMLDPENHVVFFVRRIVVDLRIESVLLGSEDPLDILRDKHPHPETQIEVQREEVVAGQREWVSLTSTECRDQGTHRTRYQLKCGDNVRLVVHPAQHRGQQWRWWSALPKYVVPAGGGTGVHPATYRLVVDTDIAPFDATDCNGTSLDHREIRMQAAFRQLMIIESIGLRVRVNAQGDRQQARFEERWFDPLVYYDRDADEPTDGRQLEYIPRRGTPIRIRFSLPLDPLSVLGGSVSAESFDNILLTNPNEQDLDFSVQADTTGNTNILSSTGQFLDVVELFVCDPTTKPRKQALHTGSVDFTCGTGVRSYSGQMLRASQTFALRRMEMPGYGIKLNTVEYFDDGDWDLWPFVNRGELYHAVYGGNLTARKALLTDHGFTRMPSCDEQQGTIGECTTVHGDEDGPLAFGERSLWLQTSWMDQADLAWVRMSTWDEDCKDDNDCLVNRLDEVIDSLRSRVAKFNVPVDMAALNWKMLLPDIIKTGVDLIGAMAKPDDQDDFIAECTILEDSQTLWGMRTQQAPYIRRYHENADYEFKGQWYTSRAVVR